MTDQVCTFIEEILETDRNVPRKQRHTAKRIHDRLIEDKDFTGSYRVVAKFVSKWREKEGKQRQTFKELSWEPRCAQIDFGEVKIDCGEENLTKLWMLVVSFPYSNARFAQLYRGQTAECVVDGLQQIFTHIGFVPHTQIFDNATGIGRKNTNGIVETDLFMRFCAGLVAPP